MNKWLKKESVRLNGLRTLAKRAEMALLLLAVMCMMLWSTTALAAEDDNSLSSLGILTEGVSVSPEFAYNTWSYTVTVPGGTKELELDPVPSSGRASISGINGTVLNEDGTGYVTITVQAGNGSQFTYELNVVSDGTVPAETETETEKETEAQTEPETEPETEDSRYVKVDKNSLQEAENTITNLKEQITAYKDKVDLYTKIMYGLIGFAVLLLFVVINLLLKKKDLKAELNDYRSYGYTDSKKSLKAQAKAEKKQEKADRKAEKKAGKKQKKNAVSMEEEDNISYGQPIPAANQNNMQSGYQASNPYDQRMSAYPAGTPVQQPYSGLDVQPQVSQKKAKQMPQYEQPMSQPIPQSQPMPRKQPVQQPAGNTSKGKKNTVEVNMIDL